MTDVTVSSFLAALPEDRRASIRAVRKTINDNLPAGSKEGLQFGMLGWFVPLSTYPDGYGGKKTEPLPLLGVGSKKNYISLHMGVCFYGRDDLLEWFTAEYKKSGKKLDMGMGCVRFEDLADFPLELLGRTIARIPVADHVKSYRAMREGMGKGKRK